MSKSGLQHVLFYLILCGFSRLTYAQNTEGAEPSNGTESFRPRGKAIFSEKSHDFGKVKRGEKLSYSFNFKNAGPGSLAIQGVHAACGCTAVQVDTSKIYGPGQSGAIDVLLDTSNFEGRVQKSVSVITNESEGSALVLNVEAQIDSEISAEPPLVDFGQVTTNEGAQREFLVKVESGVNVLKDQIRFNREILDVTIADAPKAGNYLVSVNLKKDLKTGFVKELILIPNTSSAMKELRVPVRVNLVGSVQLAQNYIEFGALASGEAVERRIRVQSKQGTKIGNPKFELIVNHSKVEQAEKYLQIEYKSPEASSMEKGKYLALKLNHAGGANGSVHGRVILETDDPQQREVSVDIYAFFKQ